MTPGPARESVADRLARSGAMSVDEAIEIGVGVADALAELHRRHEVHGGVTTERIWLEGPRVTLAPSDPATPDGHGEVRAPEVLGGDAPDARSDHFALGCVLYEMVAGRPPFAGATADAVADAVRAGNVTPLSRHQPLVPPSLVRLVDTCLEPDPDRRWQSARDLGRELAWVGTLDEAASERLEDDTRVSTPRLYGLLGLAAGFVLSGAVRACGS
ncbi:MAG: protein kinase [bacterium]